MTATTISSATTSYSLYSTVYSCLQPLCIPQSQSLYSPPTAVIRLNPILSRAVYSLQSTVYSLQSTVCSLQSTAYSHQQPPLPCRLQTTVQSPTPPLPLQSSSLHCSGERSTVFTAQQTSLEYSSFPHPTPSIKTIILNGK